MRSIESSPFISNKELLEQTGLDISVATLTSYYDLRASNTGTHFDGPF